MKVISQREARRLQKRVKQLMQLQSDQHAGWSTDYPGIHIASYTGFTSDSPAAVAIKIARRLGRVVVVTAHDNGDLKFFAARPVS